MNPIEGLRDALVKRFPDIATEIDAPADEAGLWQLDVRPGGGSPWIVVEWRPDLGFGVSTPGADDYGTKPDEIYANPKAAYDRVAQLILSGGRTEPPAAVRLAELRRFRKLSQAEVAGRAGIKQAAIARIEGRGDILLSTLASRRLGDGRPAVDSGRISRRHGERVDRPGPVASGWIGREAGSGEPAGSKPLGVRTARASATDRSVKASRGPEPHRAELTGGQEASNAPGEPSAKKRGNSAGKRSSRGRPAGGHSPEPMPTRHRLGATPRSGRRPVVGSPRTGPDRTGRAGGDAVRRVQPERDDQAPTRAPSPIPAPEPPVTP